MSHATVIKSKKGTESNINQNKINTFKKHLHIKIKNLEKGNNNTNNNNNNNKKNRCRVKTTEAN